MKDVNPLLDILRLNIPKYFHESELKAYHNYLEHEIEDYFVLSLNEKVIGGGGINYLHAEKEARISWDVIHTQYQGKGLGKKLLTYRLNQITHYFPEYSIIVRTSQFASGFYEKNHFKIQYREKDFWAEGFDLIQMKFIPSLV